MMSLKSSFYFSGHVDDTKKVFPNNCNLFKGLYTMKVNGNYNLSDPIKLNKAVDNCNMCLNEVVPGKINLL